MTGDAETAKRIWEVLASHRGAARAITAAQIARRVGMEDDPAGTRVRAILSRALELSPWPVLASGRGYFIIEAGDEADRYCATLMSRLKKIGRRFVVTRKVLFARGWRLEDGHWAAPPAAQKELFKA